MNKIFALGGYKTFLHLLLFAVQYFLTTENAEEMSLSSDSDKGEMASDDDGSIEEWVTPSKKKK